jgi:c-di-AMP phosphodiesterase-like protein
MSSRFKCLIELNNYKYSVYINSNNNLITFANVFNEIQNQIKQNISYETHLFEV